MKLRPRSKSLEEIASPSQVTLPEAGTESASRSASCCVARVAALSLDTGVNASRRRQMARIIGDITGNPDALALQGLQPTRHDRLDFDPFAPGQRKLPRNGLLHG